MELGLSGKKVLVTGGTQGIGFALAQGFVAEGAEVIIASRDVGNVEAAVAKLGRVKGFSADLTREDSLRELLDRCGDLDVLINNVGGPATGTPMTLSLEKWDAGYTSLLRSVLISTSMVVPAMREKKWGRILTVTSTSARQVIPNLPISSTFRSALTAFTKELAREVGKDGILVNNLLPGSTATARLKELEHESPDYYRSMEKESALGRLADPMELARIGVFLCSNANTIVTGIDMVADGGATRAL